MSGRGSRRPTQRQIRKKDSLENDKDLIQRLSEFLLSYFPSLSDLTKRQRYFVVECALNHLRGKNRHWHYDDACRHYHKDVRKAFRTRRLFNQFNDTAEWFLILAGFSVQERFCRGYRLINRDVADKVRLFLIEDSAREKPLTDYRGKPLSSPPCSIISRDRKDNHRKSKAQLETSIVEIDYPALLKLRQTLTNTEDFSKLCALDSLIHQSTLEGYGRGYLVQQYRECPHGRLMGIADGIHLQQMPSWLRNAALHGQFSYDIETCHLTLLYEIARLYGTRLRSIETAIFEKQKFRNDLGIRHGRTYEEIKQAIQAVSYGAVLSISDFCAFRKEIFPNSRKGPCSKKEMTDTELQEFLDDSEIVALAKDVKSAHNIVLTNRRISRGKTRNCIGKYCAGGPRTLVSHILLGYEARALDIAIEHTKGNLSLLLHDGFVSPIEIDSQQIVKRFEKETGLKIKYEQECLSSGNYKNT